MPSRQATCTAALVLVVTLAGGRAGRALDRRLDLWGQRIVAIEFRCSAPIDRRDLRRLMPMQVGDVLRQEDVEEARRRLTLKGLFADVSIDIETRKTGVAVVGRLQRLPMLNAIRFRGNDAVGDRTLRRLSRLRTGMPLPETLRRYAVDRIHDYYLDEGFKSVQVATTLTTRSPGEVDITFRIEEGEALRIETLDIEGHVAVPPEKVRKAIEIAAGDRYVPRQVRAAQTAVVRLLREKQYYDAQVDSTWERSADTWGRLRFRIDAGPLFALVFAGNHHLSDRTLLGLMDLQARPIITDGTWRELARRARRAYHEAGYYFAQVTVEIEPGAPKRVRFDVTEGKVFHVQRVEFEGNQRLSARELRQAMATRARSWIPWRHGGVLLDDVLDDDLRRLWSLYRKHGFQSAEIVDARTRIDRERGSIVLTIVIEEGRQTLVREIGRTGMEPIVDRLPELQTKVGAPLDVERVEADRRAVLNAFYQAGYTQAEVRADVTTRPQDMTEGAAVAFAAVPGERQRVGTIIVQNNFDTRARVILRELPFRSNEPLDPDALLRGQSSIYRLGLFRSVTVRPLGSETATDHRDVAVSVSEKAPAMIQWGIGYNTRDGFRGGGEISHNNIQGLARRLRLRGGLSLEPGDVVPNEYLGDLGFHEPRLANTRFDFRSDLIAQRSTRSIDQFSLERLALVPAVTWSVLPEFKVGLVTEVERSRVFDVKSDVLEFNPGDEGRFLTLSLGPFAVYDGRDDAFVPRRGVFDSLRLRFAPAQFGADIPFVKLDGQHSHYVPLSEEVTLIYAVRGGWARALTSGDEVPIRERFFLGGRTTVRGFRENSIGPEGSEGSPLGGDLVLNLNTELRFPLLYGIGGAVFVDAGGVYLQDRSVSVHDFRRSAGLGLRYITPVGSLSLDYGFKLDRRSGESIGEVHFSVGNNF